MRATYSSIDNGEVYKDDASFAAAGELQKKSHYKFEKVLGMHRVMQLALVSIRLMLSIHYTALAHTERSRKPGKSVRDDVWRSRLSGSKIQKQTQRFKQLLKMKSVS